MHRWSMQRWERQSWARPSPLASDARRRPGSDAETGVRRGQRGRTWPRTAAPGVPNPCKPGAPRENPQRARVPAGHGEPVTRAGAPGTRASSPAHRPVAIGDAAPARERRPRQAARAPANINRPPRRGEDTLLCNASPALVLSTPLGARHAHAPSRA